MANPRVAAMALGMLAAFAGPGWAATDPASGDVTAAPVDAAAQAKAEKTAPHDRPPNWETAAGLFVNVAPTYAGSASRQSRLQLGYYLRRGRWSLTNRSDLISRSGEEVVSGLAADLVDKATLRVAAGLRIDNGRSSSADPALAGLDAIPATLRLRLVTESRLPGPWQASLALSSDLLRRGGGNTLTLRGWRDWGLGRGLRLNVGAGITAGDATYMQSWFGVSEAEAARTGRPVYLPGAGLNELSLGANLRWEVDAPWVLFASGGVSRMIGPSAQSPLTQSLGSWGLNLGLGRQF